MQIPLQNALLEDLPQLQPETASQLQLKQRKKLQGDCKIKSHELLRINYLKMFVSIILMTVSVVGLLLLKYYPRLRAFLFYSKIQPGDSKSSTHVYITSSDKLQEIVKLNIEVSENIKKTVFYFRYLKYSIITNECYPVGLNYIDNINDYLNPIFKKRGLSYQQTKKKELQYGKNEHKVQIPNYFEYLFQVMTKPFFVLQYLSSLIWILQGYALFGLVMIFFSAVTTTINYILLYRSYKNIQQTAQKKYQVTVLRQAKIITIYNTQIVPGDVFQPKDQIPCDSILIQGELFVDQASLTGQNVPIPKIYLTDSKQINQSNHWIFEGSRVQKTKQGTLAMAIHVGFTSRKGRIIRKILTKIPKQPQFFIKLMIFLVQVMLICCIIFAVTLHILLAQPIEQIMIMFRFLDFVTYTFAPSYPIFFNLAYSACLVRLHGKGIMGTESEKTIEASRIRTICFDKTGTLTINQMSVANVYAFQDQKNEQSSKNQENICDISRQFMSNQIIRDVFACCHSVEEFRGSLRGDQVDLRMFQHSQGKLLNTNSSVRKIKIDQRQIEILRINAYQSHFQSMSVLCKTPQNSYFIFSKGSPQKIHSYSTTKHKNFQQFIKSLSLGGYRSIAFSYKQIPSSQVDYYLKAGRQQFLKQTKILGVVTFVNSLKSDARQTITTLTNSQINSKVITGDNIFLGVKTAMMTRIVSENSDVVILQGRKLSSNHRDIDVTRLKNVQNKIIQKQQTIYDFKFQDECVYAVDNDFIQKRADFMHQRVKVFARVPPQNKALIVRKHIQRQKQLIRKRTLIQKIFGQASRKVGMVGDGANDLMAIKQANVGIGISNSDAVYSATFAAQSLHDIVEIVLQAKNIQRQIVEMAQFYGLINLISVISSVLMANDAAYFTSMQFIYKNFALTVPLTVLFGLSRPHTQLTAQLPASNLMGLQHHLVFWGNALIVSVGMTLGYLLLFNSQDFIINSQREVTFQSGWNGQCMSSTLVCLLGMICSLFLALLLYRSKPWKERIYKNVLMTVFIGINLGLIGLILLYSGQVRWLTLVGIPKNWVWSELAVMAGTFVLGFLWNHILEKKKLHVRNQKLYD